MRMDSNSCDKKKRWKNNNVKKSIRRRICLSMSLERSKSTGCRIHWSHSSCLQNRRQASDSEHEILINAQV